MLNLYRIGEGGRCRYIIITTLPAKIPLFFYNFTISDILVQFCKLFVKVKCSTIISLSAIVRSCPFTLERRLISDSAMLFSISSLALSDQHVVVRNAALFALGQFAEHLQVRHCKIDYVITDKFRSTNIYLLISSQISVSLLQTFCLCCLIILVKPVGRPTHREYPERITPSRHFVKT